MKLGDVHVEVKGDTAKVRGELKDLKAESDTAATGMSAGWKKVGVALTAVGVAAGAAAVLITKSAVSAFATWETELANMSKVTDESFASITQKIRSIDPEFGTSTELVKGYYQVISAGVKDPVQQLATLETAAKLAKTAHMDQGKAVEGLTSVMDAFGVESGEAGDALQQIEKIGKTSVAKLTPIIGEIAGTSSLLGISLNEMGAAFGRVTLQSGGTEKAATQYKAIMVSLMAPSKSMKELLVEYGGAQKAIKELGFAGVLDLIKTASGGNATELKALMGSAEAVIGVTAILSDDMVGLGENMEQMKGKTGALDKAWDDYKVTLNAIWDTFKTTIGDQLILLGERLAPAIKKVVKAIGGWMEENQELINQKIGAVVEGITKVVKFLADNFDLLKTAVNTVKEVFVIISNIFQITGKAIALVASSLVDAYDATVKLTKDGIEYLTKKVDEVTTKVGDFKESVVGLTKNAIEYLGNKIDWVIKKIKSFTDKLAKPAKWLLKFMGKGSTETYVLEKVDEVDRAVSGLSKSVEEADPDYTIDFTSATTDVNAMVATFEQGERDKRTAADLTETALTDPAVGNYALIKTSHDSSVDDMVLAYEIGEGDKLTATEDLVEDAKLGYKDLAEESEFWAEASKTAIANFAAESEKALSDLFFDVATDKFESFEDYIESWSKGVLRIFSNLASQMAMQWMLGGLTTTPQPQQPAAPGGGQATGALLAAGAGGAKYRGAAMAGGLGMLGYTTLGAAVGMPQGTYATLGSGLGAAVGMYYGGPWGAAAGAVVGGYMGSLLDKDEPSGRRETRIAVSIPDILAGEMDEVYARLGAYEGIPESTLQNIKAGLTTVYGETVQRVSYALHLLEETGQVTFKNLSDDARSFSENIYTISTNVGDDIERTLEQIADAFELYLDNIAMQLDFENMEELLEYAARIEEAFLFSAGAVREALQAALDVEEPLERWGKFTEAIKEKLYDSIVSGMIEALLQSALFSQFLLPITLQIQDAFDAAFAGTTFNAEAFYNTINPLLENLYIRLAILEPAFEAVSGVASRIGTILLPPPPEPEETPSRQFGGILHRTGLFYGHKNETVLTPEQIQATEKNKDKDKGSEAVNNYFYIQAVDAKSFADLCKRNPKAIIGPLAESAMRGGEFRKVVKGMK